MTSKRSPIIYKGRSLGIIVLTVAQLFIGVIHALIGVLLIAFGASILQATEAYNVYTLVFGLLVMVFAVFIWQDKKAGWIGTISVSLFVTAADALTVSNLPSIPGIPKFAAPIEIGYSILVIIYLSLPHVKRKFFA
jgi:glucose dehydrogenase